MNDNDDFFEVDTSDLEPPANARAVQKEVSDIEARIRDGLTSGDIADDDLSTLQAQLEEKRAWLRRNGVRNPASRQRPEYWLVPAIPSPRAIHLANGLTDLADISSSPRSLETTAREIGHAVRIANEADGIPVYGFDPFPKACWTAPSDCGPASGSALERKRLLLELSNAEQALIVAYARLAAIEAAVEQASMAAQIPERISEAMERDRRFRGSGSTGYDQNDEAIARSVDAWRCVIDASR